MKINVSQCTNKINSYNISDLYPMNMKLLPFYYYGLLHIPLYWADVTNPKL